MSLVNKKFAARLAAGLLLIPGIALAQPKEEKPIDKKETQQITITRTGGADKVVIEINGDKVTVNGKDVNDLKEQDVKVKVRKFRDSEALFERIPREGGVWNWNDGMSNFQMEDKMIFQGEENRAMLGVTTQKVENGAQVQDITPGSAAEKAELKENDIITKVDEDKIGSPDDLSAAIKKRKPGDKVKITYLRDNKEKTVTTELTKWKGVRAWSAGPGQNFRMDLGDLGLDKIMPHIQELPRMEGFENNFNRGGNGPKLGLTVQDTDEGKGVKVIDVDEESNAAKADIKEGDIITEFDGKAVNSTDDMVKMIRESKEKISVSLKLKRDGKTLTKDVKMPRKLKVADL